MAGEDGGETHWYVDVKGFVPPISGGGIMVVHLSFQIGGGSSNLSRRSTHSVIRLFGYSVIWGLGIL